MRADTPSPNKSIEAHKKIHVPSDWGDWLGTEFRGLVQFERAFGMPTGLEDHQEIWLVIEQVDYRAKIWLNQHLDDSQNTNCETPLGELQLGQAPFRRSIRPLMQARNRLRLEIESPLDVDRGPRAWDGWWFGRRGPA